MAADKEARGAFIRAMEPVRGKRFLTVRKTRNPLARAMGSRTKRFYSEFKIDSGYCVMWAFKDTEGGKPVEEYRFMGTSITADVLMDWPDELGVTEPEFRACLVVKGSDLKREDGRQLPGELYLFANDSGFILQMKQAVLALARSAKPPDAACVFGKITFEKFNARTAEITNFKLDRDDAIMITRACSRLTALSSVVPGIFGKEAMRMDPDAALALLKTPPSTDAEDDIGTIVLTGRALLEALKRLKVRPVSASVFMMFSTQAEKCRFRFENATGGHSGQLGDSDEFASVVIDFLRDLGSQDALNVLREVTRVVKHVVFDIRGAISLLDCVDAFGPLLVENFKRQDARELGWFFAAACSKNRDRIFNKALSTAPVFTPDASKVPLEPILRNKRSLSVNSDTQAVPPSPRPAETSSVSPRAKVVEGSPRHEAVEPLNTNGHAEEEPEPASEAVISSIEHESIEVEQAVLPEESMAESVSTLPPAVVAATIEVDDFENIQEEIDSLTRLYEFLRTRLRDEPNHPNAGLWRKEMDACQAEIVALGPTMFFVAPRKDQPSSVVFGGPTNNVSDLSASAAVEDREGEAGSAPNFVERALSLWAESRKEALHGSKDQLDESLVVLKTTLQDVRSLASNVDAFPDVSRADKQSREASLAMVGLLEENVSLRLKLIGKGGEDQTPSSHEQHESSASSKVESKSEADGPNVDEEEYEI